MVNKKCPGNLFSSTHNIYCPDAPTVHEQQRQTNANYEQNAARTMK